MEIEFPKHRLRNTAPKLTKDMPMALDTFGGTTNKDRVDIEVLLDQEEDDFLTVRTDESKRPLQISRTGIKLKEVEGSLAVLNMTERRAINLGLV